jgi:hypothetical protein
VAIWEAEIGRISVQGQPGQTVYHTLISKITRAKWTGAVVKGQSTCFASVKPSSNPSPTEEEEEEEKEKEN